MHAPITHRGIIGLIYCDTLLCLLLLAAPHAHPEQQASSLSTNSPANLARLVRRPASIPPPPKDRPRDLYHTLLHVKHGPDVGQRRIVCLAGQYSQSCSHL